MISSAQIGSKGWQEALGQVYEDTELPLLKHIAGSILSDAHASKYQGK